MGRTPTPRLHSTYASAYLDDIIIYSSIYHIGGLSWDPWDGWDSQQSQRSVQTVMVNRSLKGMNELKLNWLVIWFWFFVMLLTISPSALIRIVRVSLIHSSPLHTELTKSWTPIALTDMSIKQLQITIMAWSKRRRLEQLRTVYGNIRSLSV